MKLPVHNAEGKQVRQITVDDSVFGITPNIAVLHQAFVAQRANQRRGTASTKSRGEVRGSTRKLRAQKYTGRARQGSNRSPVRVGGGVAFGPSPRSYRQALPKKMRRLAIRSALSGKVADGQFHVVDRMEFAQRRTKEMTRMLRNVGIERSALIVTDEPDRSVFVSARNLQKTKVLPAAYLNVVDLLTHRDLLLTQDAVRRVEGMWGAQAGKPAAVEEPKPRRRRAAAPEEPAAEVEAPVEEKPRRRRAAVAEKAAAAEAAEKPARRTRRPKAEAAEKPAGRTRRPRAEAAEKPQAQPEKEPKPARRRSRAKKGEEA
jgi:large subunit ribosomal protein L4